jgi:hypothetical protein
MRFYNFRSHATNRPIELFYGPACDYSRLRLVEAENWRSKYSETLTVGISDC